MLPPALTSDTTRSLTELRTKPAPDRVKAEPFASAKVWLGLEL